MRILSLDPGINNLAYCVLDVTTDFTWKVHAWGIIDLRDSTAQCQYPNCQSSIAASVTITTPDATLAIKQHFCSNHTKAKIIKNLTKKELMYSHVCSLCQTPTLAASRCICVPATARPLRLCSTHRDNIVITTKKLSKAQKKRTIEEVITILCERLDIVFPTLDGIDVVLVENQTVIQMGMVKLVSVALFSYFVTRKVRERITMAVTFVSPQNKLRKLLGNNHAAIKNYTKTKATAVQCVEKLLTLTEDTIAIDILNKSRKKDDLCDTYLQAIQFIVEDIPTEYLTALQSLFITDTNTAK